MYDAINAILLTRAGGFDHLMIGSVNLAFLWSLLLESIPVIILGSLLSRQIRDDWLRLILVISRVIMGAKVLSWSEITAKEITSHQFFHEKWNNIYTFPAIIDAHWLKIVQSWL